VLLAYVDDSGSHVGEHRLFLAGYILGEDQWRTFNFDWLAALEERKSLASLHMTQSFNGWAHDERAEKLSQLAGVIRKHRPTSVEVSLNTRDFKEILGPNSPYDLRHPYFSCFYALMVTAARLVHQLGMRGPINFVFDSQGNVGAEAAVWYEPMRQMQEEHIQALLGTAPVFRNDDDEPGLQAADMLAWHRRLLVEPNCTDAQRAFADSIVFTHAIAEIPKEMLESWAAHFATVPGIEDAKGKRGSVTKTVARILGAVPREEALSIMQELDRQARRGRWLKTFLTRIGLHTVWKWLSKRPVSLRALPVPPRAEDKRKS